MIAANRDMGHRGTGLAARSGETSLCKDVSPEPLQETLIYLILPPSSCRTAEKPRYLEVPGEEYGTLRGGEDLPR